MAQLFQILGIVVVTLLSVASLRVVGDLIARGARRVREVREEGGGVVQKFTGELVGGQGSASTKRRNGINMVVRDGEIHWRGKSAVSKQPS